MIRMQPKRNSRFVSDLTRVLEPKNRILGNGATTEAIGSHYGEMDSQNYAENEVPEDGNVCHKAEKKTSVHGAPTPATIWLRVNIKQNCQSVTEMLHKDTCQNSR